MQGYEHLDLRRQFYIRMADKLLRNSDAAYTFMGVVCETVSISDLPTIEAIFINKTNEITQSKN
jgi:hypothetical protein